MEHFNIDTKSNTSFVVFHGTGGNEYSLLQVVGDLDPTANIRAYIGDVGTGTERRFFAPLENGHLNRSDVDMHVASFLTDWAEQKPEGKVIMLGYSNGANFLLALLEKEPNLADAVVLLHPSNLTYHFSGTSNTALFLTAGARDMISIPGESLNLSKTLAEHFPQTTFKLFDHGHEIADEEVDFIRSKLASL
ncbi:alpha/beta hydrolase [Planomicrobium sp. CPCC 101079]|uniref:alpha/beta hydrolase n=1 Tax=Planomicrobium sp. CPCC 101079 TaxID=2599618 RepID=UPI0011B7F3B9|nr:phospholipase [Planomicrobium sp. CPCC 101079]TWT00588.1 phospholipase [Planomicrobium sp. CPCC 101079]